MRHLANGPGDAEIDQARNAVGADEDVPRRNAAVHDAERLAELVLGVVRSMETVKDAGKDGAGDGRVEALARGPHRFGEKRQTLAGHERGDNEDISAVSHDVERRYDVRVLDARGEPYFIEERRDEVRILREGRGELLDSHRRRGTGGPHEPPDVNGTRLVPPNLGEERIPAAAALPRSRRLSHERSLRESARR